MTPESRIVSHPIAAPAAAVYAYASRMENIPHWAAGLVTNIQRDGDGWYTDTPGGRVGIKMAPRNDYGVLDHDVTLPNGVTTHNAMRVTPVGDGSLLHFVVLRAAGMSDADFEKDCATVTADLKALGQLVETAARG